MDACVLFLQPERKMTFLKLVVAERSRFESHHASTTEIGIVAPLIHDLQKQQESTMSAQSVIDLHLSCGNHEAQSLGSLAVC